jgi:hypothetical protein
MEEVWVRVEGIPPKYLSWRVMMRVATALGIPIDVDWHEIFRSFYKVLRIKVAVRDVTKIPGNRLMEFGGRNFMLSLAVVQDPVGEGDNGDGNDPDNNHEDDTLEEDMGRDDDLPNDGGKKPMETEQNEKTPRTSPAPGGSGQRKVCGDFLTACTSQLSGENRVKSKIMGTPVRQYKLSRDDNFKAPEENIGVQLLSQFDSEADDDDDEEEAALEMTSVEQIIEEKRKTKGIDSKWGPVMATRMSSRIVHDGKSIIKKAKELKKNKNLEIPKGMPHGYKNSFAVLDNLCLMSKASDAGILLGADKIMIDKNIDAIKHLEKVRLIGFREENPDMFLPANLDISQDMLDNDEDQDSPDCVSSGTHQIDYGEEVSPWVEVFSKKSSSKRKLIFRSNGSRPYSEHKRS